MASPEAKERMFHRWEAVGGYPFTQEPFGIIVIEDDQPLNRRVVVILNVRGKRHPALQISFGMN